MTDQLKALAEAATKGPWKHYGLDGGHLVFEDAAGSSIASSIGRNHVENAKYIAAANPQRILALIAENERLAHSRKDAEPVAAFVLSKADNKTPFTWAQGSKAVAEYEAEGFAVTKLYAHPPEAGKLLQQALEALTAMQMEAAYRNCSMKICDDSIDAIRTYLEGKK